MESAAGGALAAGATWTSFLLFLNVCLQSPSGWPHACTASRRLLMGRRCCCRLKARVSLGYTRRHRARKSRKAARGGTWRDPSILQSNVPAMRRLRHRAAAIRVTQI
ncbi:hypothetical protein MRX96_037722 [Rhipicephalus microplus]